MTTKSNEINKSNKSNILCLDKNTDLYISYTWYSTGDHMTMTHGICGHTFEVIEYFWILKNIFKCKMLWPETTPTWEMIEIAIRSKYDFNDDEIEYIKDCSEFSSNIKLLKGNNILLVDGEYHRLSNNTLLFKNVLMFACGVKDLYKIDKNNIHILQDYKIYKYGERTINYTKKILFSRFKKIEKFEDNIFIYLSSNCRTVPKDDLKELLDKYSSKNILIGTDIVETYEYLYKDYSNVKIKILPIINLTEKFNTFIYTSTPRKWDCSNRMIPESIFYDKKVLMHLDDDYLEYDIALKVRLDDISKNNLNDITLTEDDEIINIISNIIQIQ